MNQQDQRERFEKAWRDEYPQRGESEYFIDELCDYISERTHAGLIGYTLGYEAARREVIAAKDAEIARLHKERDHYVIELANSLEREYENRKALLASQEGA